MIPDYLVMFVFQEDSLQFFKEEIVEGGVFNVYLKKVRYHTPDDVGITTPITGDGSNSQFYLDIAASIDIGHRCHYYYT